MLLATLIQDLDPSYPAVFRLDDWVVSLLLATIIPVVAGFLLNDRSPNWVKVVLGGALTVAATLLKEFVQDDGSAVLSGEFLVQFFQIYVPQIALYYGVWKPLDINRITGKGVTPAAPIEVEAVNRTESNARTP